MSRGKAAGLLAIGWAAWFWTWTSRVMLSSLVPGIMEDLMLGPAEGSAIAAAINAGWATGTFALGLAGSVVGAATAAIGSLVLSGLILTSLSPQHSYLAVIVLFAAAGIFLGGFSPNGIVVVASTFKRRRRGGAIGIFDTAVPLGLSAGGIIVALLYLALGWRGLALYWGLIGLIAAGAFAALKPSGVRRRRNIGVPLRTLMPFIVAYVGAVASGVGLVVYMPLFLTTFVGATLEEAAWIVGFSRMFGIVGQVLSGWLSDRYGRWRILAIINAIMIGTGSVVALTAMTRWVTYALILNFLFTTPFYPVIYATMYETFGDATSAALGSAMSVGNLVGSSLIIPVMMYLDTSIAPSAGLWLVPVLVAFGLTSLIASRGALSPR